jgi:hypothetical protein
MSSQSNGIPIGPILPSSSQGEFNALSFVIEQALSKMQTALPVKVISCTNSGGLSPVGTVDIQPLVNQVDGDGNPTPHSTIHTVPYVRIQGGANAVIIDPQPGDIGVAVFASQDITKVKNTKGQANPGSFRIFDWGDAMYLGGALNGVPTQYIQFTAAGINIVSPNAVTITAPHVAAESMGGTPHALVIDDWLTWYTEHVQPFIVSKGYTGPDAPTVSQTTILKGQ